MAAAAALLPLLKAWGAPLGEPVADDYDFLHRVLLEPANLFDGGGAEIYWRPLARQLYYAATAQGMLSHPWIIALVHVLLLAASAALIQRALAPVLGGARAAAAATFPVIADSARTLILWPAAIQDLGALFFCALALHQTTRRRLPATLAAIAAALLCKEVALIPAVLLPFTPEPAGSPRRDRGRWLLAIGGMIAVWGIAYWTVLRSAHLMVQGQLEAARPALAARLGWAFRAALQDGFGLASAPWAVAIGVAAAVTLLGLLAHRAAPRKSLGWIACGALWFALATATLSETYPVWGSFRGTVGLAGLGIACGAALAAWPLALGGLVAVRLAMLLLAAPAPATITVAPPGDGAGFDFATLARLQLVSREARAALGRVPPGDAAVLWLQRPLMSERAFAHAKALQVWFRNPALRWTQLQEVVDDSTLAVGPALSYEPEGTPQVIATSALSVRELATAIRRMRADDYPGALENLARADRAGNGTVLRGMVAGKRALCYLAQDDDEPARLEAERSLSLWDGGDGHYVFAVLLSSRGKLAEAIAELDTVLSFYPSDRSATMLRDTLRAQAGAPR